MSELARGGPVLSGLVSAEAAGLYSRLLVNGALPIGRGPSEIDIESSPALELLTIGAAFRSGVDDALVRPVRPAMALRAALKSRHEQLNEQLRLLGEGWQRLEEQLPSAITGGSPTARGAPDVLTDAAKIAQVVAELYYSTKAQLRGTETGEFLTRPSRDRIFKPPPSAIGAGVKYRYVYQASYHNTTWGRRIIEDSAAAGEQVRLRRFMPVKMLLVDDTVALLALDRVGQTALLIRSAGVLAMLAEWFDLVWNDPLTTAIGDTPPGLRPEHTRVLRLLLTTESDAAIARSLNVSVTTVRRHVKLIYQALGVNSRFAAGAAAARLGWI